MAASIADGSADVQDAYDQLIASISSNVSASGAIKDAGKEAFTQPLATSIQENQGEVVEAVSEMAEAAADAAQEASTQFQSAGSSRAREKKAPTNTRRESNLSKGRLIRRAETLEAQVIRRQRPISRHGMTLAYIWGRVSLRD